MIYYMEKNSKSQSECCKPGWREECPYHYWMDGGDMPGTFIFLPLQSLCTYELLPAAATYLRGQFFYPDVFAVN